MRTLTSHRTRRRTLGWGACGLLALSIAPASALAAPTSPTDVAIDSLWVVVAAILVLFMQAGFAMLEIGLSRMKNAASVAAKIMVNLSIAFICFWATGFALAFGDGSDFAGSSGWFLDRGGDYGALAFSSIPVEAKFFFQAVFCAVSLAIVFGTMLDRTRFWAQAAFAAVFCSLIYPVVAHWTWGGGWLGQLGFQDFAGSSIVHLQGALGALAGTLLLGPRIGRYVKGRSVPIPGHSMPLAILGVIILWIGWMGFNPGSFLGAIGVNFADVAVNTNLAAAAGVLGALVASLAVFRTADVSQVGNGALAGLVAITAPCAFVDAWAALVIGLVAGLAVPPLVLMIDRLRIDDPVGCLPVHGLAGIWGTIACGLFAAPERVAALGVGEPGLLLGGGAHQLGIQALGVGATIAFVLPACALVFWLIRLSVGLRVPAEAELAGLDISEHGMFGYPERFIEVPGADPQAPAAGTLILGTEAPSAGSGAALANPAGA